MLSLLTIENLSVDFISENGITNAVKNISLTVNKGEIVALVGESGSGKSVTSLSILQLLPKPPARYPQGKIIFTDEEKSIDLLQLGHKELRIIRGNKVAMIFQEPMSSLNPVISCGEQVMEALLVHKKLSRQQAKEQTIQWFEKVKLPEPQQMFNRYPHQLSGGQKQRVMIAMAMCCQPQLLICDEPTTALDVTVQKAILQLIKELQQEQNMGVIFITHDLGVVAQIADRIAIMYKGEIVEEGSVDTLFHKAAHPYTKALIACRPGLHPKGKKLPMVSDYLSNSSQISLSETVTEKHAVSNKPSSLDNLSANSKQQTPDLQLLTQNLKHQTSDDILLSVENLSVHFPAKTSLFGKPLSFVKAVDNVSLHIYKNETLGLVGESGCGKTTLGRTILRIIEPASGKIIYNGNDITRLSIKQVKDLRKDVQLIFQDPYSSLNPRLTIGAAIAEPMLVTGVETSARERKKKVAELLDKVSLSPTMMNRYPHEFSGGQRQRIVIARALGVNPNFIVCDESVSALDVSVQAQVLNLLNDLKKDLGLTLLFISHDLSVVRYMCERIAVMQSGHIIETGFAEDVYLHPQTHYTKALIEAVPKTSNSRGENQKTL